MKASSSIIGFIIILLNLNLHAQEFTKSKFRQVIQLNTSATGAGLKGDVYNFPVAIALTDSNFNFQEANRNGSDIRFSRSRDNGLLSHSIEHWDKTQKKALIWVKLDHIRGNNAIQQIFMHWGDVAAQDLSDSKQVFNNKEGFVGVWHLNETGDTSRGHYKDATANEAHGTGVNFKPGSNVETHLGKGAVFVHSENRWIKIDGQERKLFDLTNKLTFSIWALGQSYSNKGNEQLKTGPGYETMFAKGDNSWRLQKFGTRTWHTPNAELIEICVEEPPKADLCLVAKTDMVTNKWFHITAVHDYPKIRIYVNGVLDKEDTLETNWKSDDHPVGIGNQSQFPDRGRSWDGILDEARVLNVPKNEHWIKLDYESQREGQRFLVWGKKEQKF